MNRELPRPEEIWRHLKNKLYRIIAIAQHTETDEKLVVYQAMYGNNGIYARPLDMFMSKVDRKKYLLNILDEPETGGEHL